MVSCAGADYSIFQNIRRQTADLVVCTPYLVGPYGLEVLPLEVDFRIIAYRESVVDLQGCGFENFLEYACGFFNVLYGRKVISVSHCFNSL